MLLSYEEFKKEEIAASKIWRNPTDPASIAASYYLQLCRWDDSEYLDEWPVYYTRFSGAEEAEKVAKLFGLYELPEDTLAILVQPSFEADYVVKLTATEAWKETKNGVVAYTVPPAILQKARHTSWELLHATRQPYRDWFSVDGCHFSFFYQKDGALKKGHKHSPSKEGRLGELLAVLHIED